MFSFVPGRSVIIGDTIKNTNKATSILFNVFVNPYIVQVIVLTTAHL